MVASVYPPVSASTIDEVRQQRRQLEANPELQVMPVDLGIKERFIFRSRPGTVRMIEHDIPQPPMAGLDEKRDKFIRREWERRMVRTFKDADKKETNEAIIARAEKFFADITERNNGDARIRFNRVSRKNECWWSTDDAVLAGYIRDLMKRRVGEFEYVYEENGLARFVVGPDTELMKSFPNTPSGMTSAFAYAAEHEISDIKIVND